MSSSSNLARAGTPTTELPRIAASPVPPIVSPSPEMIWFAPSVTQKNACRLATSAPARRDAAMPVVSDPVSFIARNPETAPTSIIPSSPRLITPARSATVSPSAAKTSGVEAARAAVRRVVRVSTALPLR
jgi:hypothetical protein